jgi:hypothetical protein
MADCSTACCLCLSRSGAPDLALALGAQNVQAHARLHCQQAHLRACAPMRTRRPAA